MLITVWTYTQRSWSNQYIIHSLSLLESLCSTYGVYRKFGKCKAPPSPLDFVSTTRRAIILELSGVGKKIESMNYWSVYNGTSQNVYVWLWKHNIFGLCRTFWKRRPRIPKCFGFFFVPYFLVGEHVGDYLPSGRQVSSSTTWQVRNE